MITQSAVSFVSGHLVTQLGEHLGGGTCLHFGSHISMIVSETGKAASLDHSGLKLSHFAEQWERDHGGIVIENRVRRNEARAARAAHVDRYMEENYKPDPEASMRDQAVLYDETLKKARAEAGKLHRLPPMERKRSRNVDGQPVKTPEPVRQIWDDLYEKQRAENLPEPDQRKQRVEASCLQRHGPAPRVDQEPEVIVPGVPAQAFPAPSRAVRVGREPEVAVPAAPEQPCCRARGTDGYDQLVIPVSMTSIAL